MEAIVVPDRRDDVGAEGVENADGVGLGCELADDVLVGPLSSAPRERAKAGRTLTIDQARHLVEASRGHRFGVAVLIALAYGLRRGEVLGLHWSALDWKAGTLAVTHGVKRIKNRDLSSPRKTRLGAAELKTPKSRRTLPEVVTVLRPHHSRQVEAPDRRGHALA